MKYSLIIFVLLAGCSSNTNISSNSTKFSKINDIKDLEGTYLNRGSQYKFLSNLIWKNNEYQSRLTYADLINVTSENKSILVKAIQNDCVIYESEFLLGEDFNIEDGKIKLRREFSLSSSNHVGSYFREEIIGIDEHGDAKYILN